MEFLEKNIEDLGTPYLENFYKLTEVRPDRFTMKCTLMDEYLEFLKEGETAILYDKYKFRKTPSESYKLEDCFDMIVDYDIVSKGYLYDAFQLKPPKLNRDKAQIEYLQK